MLKSARKNAAMHGPHEDCALFRPRGTRLSLSRRPGNRALAAAPIHRPDPRREAIPLGKVKRPCVPSCTQIAQWEPALQRTKRSEIPHLLNLPTRKVLMGRIFIRAMRPVPVWLIFLGSGGTAEPVRMNCPNSSLWSTSNRTASHSCGASCHSSMRRGVAPLSNSRGAISARRMFCALVLGSWRYIALSSKPLACSGLAAPLSPLDQNGAFRSYTFFKQWVVYSR